MRIRPAVPVLNEDFLAAWGTEEHLIVPMRRFVRPEWQLVVAGHEPARLLDVARHMGCTADVLGAYERRTDDMNSYTGRYTATGQQQIADALGRPVTFAPQPSSEPVVDLTRAVTFHPTPAGPAEAAAA